MCVEDLGRHAKYRMSSQNICYCELLTFQGKCELLSFKVGLKRCYWGNVPNPCFTMYDRL